LKKKTILELFLFSSNHASSQSDNIKRLVFFTPLKYIS